MSNQKSNRLTRDFIKRVVQYYNNEPLTVEPKSNIQTKKIHICKICSYTFFADLEKPICKRCSEKEMIIRNA